MKIGIIHFSGTHLREAHKDHTIEYMREKMFLSLKNRLSDLKQIFIVISEGIAFSAEGEMDEQLKLFYRNLRAELRIFSNKKVDIVGAPWDHDYYFENVESGWKHIIEGLEKEQIGEKSHNLIVEYCTPEIEAGNSQENLLLKKANPKINSIKYSENLQRKETFVELEKFLKIYSESGALLDSENPNRSHFSLLSFDSDKAKICISNFNYSKRGYQENMIESDFGLVDFESRGKRRYSLSESFSEHLDSLDAQFLNKWNEKCKADQLCVDPFLKFIDPGTNKLSIGRFNKLLKGGKLDKAILVGDGGAGKTFLSKKLFKHFHSQDLIPLLLMGSEILRPDSEFVFDTLLREAFEHHYLANEHAHFDEIDRKKIVLIIDDFNGCPLKDKYRNLFVKNLNAQVEKVIFCSNSIMFFNSISHDVLAKYQIYNLVEYSFKMGSNSIRA